MHRLIVVVFIAAAVGCGAQPTAPNVNDATSKAPEAGGVLRLYTTVTEDTVDAVVQGFEQAHPGVDVEVFRAPTGELTARVAAEQREGGVRADVLWLTDPISMEQYEAQGLLAPPPQDAVRAVRPEFSSEGYVGTRILNVVVVHHDDVAAPRRWRDLATVAGNAPVALPNPEFAGSALGALGYFALNDRFGFSFYEDLKTSGAVEVQAPDEVTTGVAEGVYSAGMTLDNSVRTAAAKGSPVRLAVPDPGAVAVVSPAGMVQGAANAPAAGNFLSFVVSEPAQKSIAKTGWEPIRDDVAWPHDVRQVFPDWEAIGEDQEELLRRYRAIFGG